MTAPPPSGGGDLLPPEVLEGVGDLEWVARTVLSAALPGRHGSPLPGGGEDFLRHRPYQPGDELRFLDWKLFGRSDRLQIREFHEAGHLPVVLAIDGSSSMGFQDREGVSKLRFAAFLAAALARLSLLQRDRVGLAVPSAEGVVLLAPAPDSLRLGRVLHFLDGMVPEGDPSPHETLDRGVGLLRSPGRVVFFSDLLDSDGFEPGPLLPVLARARARGHEVTVIRLLTPMEEGRGTADGESFFDPERPRLRGEGDPGSDPDYRARLEAYYGLWRVELARVGVRMEEAHTGEPPATVLARWLRGRPEVGGRTRR